MIFYAVLSTASLIAVLAVYFSDRAGAEARLATMRAWIARNNANVITGMLGGRRHLHRREGRRRL